MLVIRSHGKYISGSEGHGGGENLRVATLAGLAHSTQEFGLDSVIRHSGMVKHSILKTSRPITISQVRSIALGTNAT
jgi:hypothetical protein